MALLSIVNSRADLDRLEKTDPAAHAEFMSHLKGTMLRRQNVAAYPENYNQADYDGPVIEPVWEEVEDLREIKAFNFTKADFE